MLRIRSPLKGGVAGKLTTALHQGWPNSELIANDILWEDIPNREVPNAFFGLGDMNFPKVRWAHTERKPYVFIDTPYWRRRSSQISDREALWRICIGSIHANKVITGLDDRRSPGWGYKSWKTDKRTHVLVAESSPTINGFIGEPHWNDYARKTLQPTRWPLQWRQKPRSGRKSGPEYATVPLEEDFKKAEYVFTSCSIVGVEALLQGIPVVCHALSAAAPVASRTVDKLIMPNRLDWFRTLQYHQFTIDEMANGTAYYILKDLYIEKYPELFS